MTRRKRYSPEKSAKPSSKSKLQRIPESPPKPGPVQPKLDGFSTPELEEIEAASERFATVQERVKDEKKKLQAEFDKEEARLITVMKKYNRDSIVIGGYTVLVLTTLKARVKGTPPPRDETALHDYDDEALDDPGPETLAETAARLRRDDPDNIPSRHTKDTPETVQPITEKADS
jgi:hypothetical protein